MFLDRWWGLLTKHVVTQHAGVGCPIDVFTLWTIPDQVASIWNVPWKQNPYHTALEAHGTRLISVLTVQDLIISRVGHDVVVIRWPVQVCDVAGMSLWKPSEHFHQLTHLCLAANVSASDMWRAYSCKMDLNRLKTDESPGVRSSKRKKGNIRRKEEQTYWALPVSAVLAPSLRDGVQVDKVVMGANGQQAAICTTTEELWVM